ncbi:MAG: hypothetical protein HYX78_16030 [Armatimonadetes bacterium]|nr:hypothetical protein [Armatimonadota bacterium]
MRMRAAVLIASLLTGLVMLDMSLARGRPVAPDRDRESIVVALAGEFRTVFANLLWIKADQYHHEFMEHNSDWTNNTDALVLDRLITRLDPHFEEAYASGARILVGMDRIGEARDYLEEGVANNPNSMMLHDEFATLLAGHLKDYEEALFHFKRAHILASDDWDRRRLSKLVDTVEQLAEERKER